MAHFFVTAQAWIEERGFTAYTEQYGQQLDDCLWSDAHKDAFGFRPREAWHYPHPDHIQAASEQVYAIIAHQCSMQRHVELANQYKLEHRITQLMQCHGWSYKESLLAVAAAHDCKHEAGGGPNGGSMDEGQFCYELELNYQLEATYRHIVRESCIRRLTLDYIPVGFRRR